MTAPGHAPEGFELSFLDRLINPDERASVALRSGLRRDLEDLLNTSPRVRGWPAHLTELDDSFLAFGVLDLATTNLASEQRQLAVIAAISALVGKWEPRLTNLHATVLPNVDPFDRALRLRITADMMLAPNPEQMVFDTVIDPVTNSVFLADPAP